MSIMALLPMIGEIIDRVIPDNNAKAKAKAELAGLAAQGELSVILKQIEVNVNEAKSKNLFVAGWRPFIGWTCGIAFAYHFVAYHIIKVVMVIFGFDTEVLPDFDMASLLTVLMGMLGLGGLRTFEKYRGVN